MTNDQKNQDHKTPGQQDQAKTGQQSGQQQKQGGQQGSQKSSPDDKNDASNQNDKSAGQK